MTVQIVSVVISGVVALSGLAAGVAIPIIQRRQARRSELRAERLEAYVAFVAAVGDAELNLAYLHREDPKAPLDEEERAFLNASRRALAEAHRSNVLLYLVAPYLLAETARLAIRELEDRVATVLTSGSAEGDFRLWESVVDQMRDDLGTISRIPSKAELRNAGFMGVA